MDGDKLLFRILGTCVAVIMLSITTVIAAGAVKIILRMVQ